MPNFGGKIWFTAIAGLLLGFVLFGMIQRGCDAQGEAPLATTSDQSEPAVRDYNQATRNNAHTYTSPVTPSTNSKTAKGRRSGAREARTSAGRNTRTPSSSRKEALVRSERARSQADSARKAELARLTQERTEKYRERSRRARADDPNTIDPAIRSSTTGVSVEDAVALSAAEAGDELRGQRGEGGSGSGSGGSGGGDGPGGGGNGSDDSGPGDSGEDSGNAELDALAALLAGLGIDQSFIDLIQQVVSGAVPPVNPFDPPPVVDPGDGDTDPVVPVDPDAPLDLTTPVIARWVPITQTGCDTLANQGLETRDLYLAFLADPNGAPVLSSKDENSLVIVDGSFHQSSLGTNGPPVLAADECAKYDTYLTIGKAAPVFLSAPDPSNWGERLQAEWFAIFNVEITQSRATFGDDRFYVHVGRFTAGSGAKIFGKLRVDYSGKLAFVEVPDWKGANTDGLGDSVPPPLPRVASVGVESSGVLGGASLLGTVTIDGPAPVGGLPVSLTTNKPGRVVLPLSVLIPEGEQSASFEIRTRASGVVETATITAISSNSQKSATLILEAPAMLSFEALKTKLLDGQHTSAVIRLTHPADIGGTTVLLTVDKPGAVSIPSIARIPAGQSRTVVTITAKGVGALTRATINASAGGITRSIEVEIIPLAVVDTNGDGVVDTADLGSFLSAFGTNSPTFDFNGDGVVDTADLGILTTRFGDTINPGGGDGPGDNPGGGETEEPVIARWIRDTPQVDCDEYPGARTADLYLGFLDPDATIPVLSSDAAHGIQIVNGEFIQHSLGSNGPTPPVVFESVPCLAFDSYLTIGGSQPSFIGLLDRLDWGPRINAIWFSLSGEYELDQEKFGDSRKYLKIARFSAGSDATIFGSVRVDYSGAIAFVEIPDWSEITATALDLNFDGQIDSVDVGIITRAYGTSNPDYDFDGDGVVDGDDLRPLLSAIGAISGL
jgi:hypothetical protein